MSIREGHAISAARTENPSFLIAESSPRAAQCMTERLATAGYHVVHVATAPDALTEMQIANHAAAIIEPCLPGQNWYQFLNAARELRPSLRVVIATDFISVAMLEEAVRLRMPCIAKDLQRLDDVIAAALGSTSSLQSGYPESRRETADCTLSRMEWELINAAIRCHQGNMSRAANSLGISRAALYNKLSRYPPSDERQDGEKPTGSRDGDSLSCIGPMTLELKLGEWRVRCQIERSSQGI